MITIKRVYEPVAESDGLRVLVDRLWPRGLKREEAAIDLWLKEVAPSAELRQWFGHDPARWLEFQKRYRAELQAAHAVAGLTQLREHAKVSPVTLLYAARDPERNNARVIRDVLTQDRART